MYPCTSRCLSPSLIRQAMVKLLISSVAPITQVQQLTMQQSALSPFGFRGEGGLESPAGITTGDEATRALETPTGSPNSRSDDQDDPSMCIMWCAIGLGALVQGAPVEKVSIHCAAVEQRARTAPRNFAVQDKVSDGFLSQEFHSSLRG